MIERRRKATAAELREDPQRRTIVERFAKWTDSKTGRARKAPLNAAGDAIVVEAQHVHDFLFRRGRDTAGREQQERPTCKRPNASRDASKMK
jgi:hypothetical protein